MQLFANIHPVTGSQRVNKTEELKVVIASEVFAVSGKAWITNPRQPVDVVQSRPRRDRQCRPLRVQFINASFLISILLKFANTD